MGCKGMIRRLLKAVKEYAPPTSNCEVVGCARLEAEDIEVLTLDPIDHEDQTLQLCAYHQEWAKERNEFARDMRDEFRAFRKQLGQEHIEETQRLAHPQDGHLREDILMGEVEEDHVPLGMATEESIQQIESNANLSELVGETDE